MTTTIGIPIFARVDLLDVTGPCEVFVSPFWETEVYLVAADENPVETTAKVSLVPHKTFANCPPLDILVVPGGVGISGVMEDEIFINFLKQQGATAKHVASVCTGALLLGAAGLLDGFKATTHWDSTPCLTLFPEIIVAPGYPRYVVSGNRITSGGVSSGIDAALELASIVAGQDAAEQIQLLIQYAPQPPFDAGDPETAPSDVYDAVWQTMKATQQQRIDQIERVVSSGALV